MTEKEFLEKLNNNEDKVTLYSDIMDGEIPFDLCELPHPKG